MVRPYRHPEDFGRVSDLLIRTYQADRQPGNWLQPRWEYLHYLCAPMFGVRVEDLARFGVWEDAGHVVGVVHFEDGCGQAYFQTDPRFGHLKEEMLDYAETHLSAELPGGKRTLRAYINDWDEELQLLARQRGYRKDDGDARHMSRFDLSGTPPAIAIPRGFTLKSLAGGNDPAKVARALHRGFNHPGEPPEQNTEIIRVLQTAPNFREDLHVVVQAPGGEFVSYCGVWHVKANRLAMVEPVATDPDFRRRGLGRAAVLEALRRARDLGATVAYVATDLPFYLAIGFRRLSAYHPWERTL